MRVFEVLEDLNLTWEVRDGIRAHSWKIEPPPATQEAMCVRFADRIAYLSHDALDAMRAGVLDGRSFPPVVLERFGAPGRAWIAEMIEAVIEHSLRVGHVAMDPETLAVMNELRDFMFERVYLTGRAPTPAGEAVEVIRRLVDHHLAHPDELPDTYREHAADPVTQVVDYVAGMTDRYALAVHDRVTTGS